MEIYCSKQLHNNATLEYKMTLSHEQDDVLGSTNVYGVRVKYISPEEFSYHYAPQVASKPQTVLKIIKQLFDANVKPEQAEAGISKLLEEKA